MPPVARHGEEVCPRASAYPRAYALKRAVERQPPGVAGLGGVPVAHGRLLDVPAQVDLAPGAQGGEVDQPGLEVAHDHVERLELLEPERRGDDRLGPPAPAVRAARDLGQSG